jgi:NNP family nitrate/nitrite transporter-like MFS transporter
LPTLIAALVYFDVSFMAWTLLGPLAPFLRDDLGLTATQQGMLTAIPLLGGSLFRPVLGILGERIGGRRASPSTSAGRRRLALRCCRSLRRW